MKIETGKRTDRPRRTMVYGVHGIGKSTFCACAPSPLFIATEEGINDLAVDRVRWDGRDQARELAEVMEAIEWIGHSKPCKTLVIDSADWLERLVFDRVAKDRGVKSIDDIPYRNGYKQAVSYWEGVLRALDWLRGLGIAIMMTSHATIERFNDPQTDPYDTYRPDLDKGSSNMVQEWCDEVLFANYRVATRKVDEHFGKVENRAIELPTAESGARVLYTSMRPFASAKNRLGLPAEIPFVYADYFAAASGGKSAPEAPQAPQAPVATKPSSPAAAAAPF